MSVVMLGHKYIPSRAGGIEVVVEELASRMVKKGYNVTCLNRAGGLIKEKSWKGIRLKTVATINLKGLAAVSSSFWGSLCAAFGRYDVVHYHAEGPAFMCWIPKIRGKKIIVTIHGLDYQRAKWGKFASWYIHCGEKAAVKFADEIIVLSEELKKYFNDIYGRKTVFIPNGVDRPELIKPDRITKIWGLKKDSYILFVGRLVPEKGIHDLIRAYQNVHTDKKLVITGGCSDSEGYCKSLLKYESDNIIFTNFQQDEVLAELYSNAWVYCQPSHLEGMPLSLLEAMSYGNCCLVSDIPECTEVVGNYALHFKTADAADLRDKLQMLCDSPETVREYKEGASDYICRKYNWDKVVGETLTIYGEGAADNENIDDQQVFVSKWWG